jgi:hypothetical protein
MTDPSTTRPNVTEAYARAEHARHMIAGFAHAMPALARCWRQVGDALADVWALGAEITRLDAALAADRIDRANLAAAGRATLAAWHGGEDDPLSYLRDELAAQGFLGRSS